MHQCLKCCLLYYILFWTNILHVSDGLSVHHQEFKTIQAYVKQMPVAVCTALNSW